MNLSSLRYGEKFGSWVCAIAKNSARRLNARYRAAIPSLSFETLRDFELSDVESEQLIGEDYAEVHEAVEALSAKIRETVGFIILTGGRYLKLRSSSAYRSERSNGGFSRAENS